MGNKRIVIGLHGLPGSGKDTLADHLVEKYGFVKMAFADELKIEIGQAFGVHPTALNDRDVKNNEMLTFSLARCQNTGFRNWFLQKNAIATENINDVLHAPRSGRWLLQQWGTEFRRSQDPNYWVKRLNRRIHRTTERRIVVSDVRYHNEAELVNTLHRGQVWEIVRLNNPHHKPEDTHLSNARLFPWAIKESLLNSEGVDRLCHLADDRLKKFISPID